MARRDIDQGGTIPGPIRCVWSYKLDNPGGPGSQKREFTDEIFRWNLRLRADEFTDFMPGTTLPAGWAARITKTAGTPTAAILANTANGVFQAALDATNEVQFAGLDWADQLVIPGSKSPYFQAWATIPTALAANQDVFIGLQTAYASPLSGVSKYIRFHLSGSMNVTVEATDGTNTTSALAPTRGLTTLAAGTYNLFTIDMHNLGKVGFWIDDTRIATVNLGSFAATDLLQPILGVQKSSGTGTPSLKVDYARAQWNRI